MNARSRRPDPRLTLGAAFVAVVVTLVGCQQSVDPGAFASSAATSGLALTVKMPAATTSTGVGQHAAAAPVAATATQLWLMIGDPGAADTITTPPFSLTGGTGQVLSFTVGNIPPGLRKRVGYKAADSSGTVVSQGLFLVDFYPGQTSSNDIDLGLPGNPSGGAIGVTGFLLVTFSGSNRLVKVNPLTGTYVEICSTFALQPHSVIVDQATGDYIVTEFGTAGSLVRVSPATGTRTVIRPSLPYARGLLQGPGGTFLVASASQLVTIDTAGNLTPCYTMGAAEGQQVIAMCHNSAGTGVLATEQYRPAINSGFLSEFLAPSFSTRTQQLDYSVHGVTNAIPTGISYSSTGTLFVAEDYNGTSNATLATIQLGGAGVRTPFYDFGTVNISEIIADPQGGCLVNERSSNTLVRIGPDHLRYLICSFPAGSYPLGLCWVAN